MASTSYGQSDRKTDMNEWRFSKETAHPKFREAFPEAVWYEEGEGDLFGSDEGFDILRSFARWRTKNAKGDTWLYFSKLIESFGYTSEEAQAEEARLDEMVRSAPKYNAEADEDFRLYMLSKNLKWMHRKSYILAAFAQFAYEGTVDERLLAKAIEYVEFELVPENMKQWGSMAEEREQLYARYLRTLKSLN